MQTIVDYPKITVIRPQGCINASNAKEFQQELTSAVAQDSHGLLLVDLEGVESLDSAGLMALVSALKMSQSVNRRFSLCCVSPAIRIIFELTQLDQVFEIFDSKASFAQAIA
jgi:anti-anti-sigma factor